MSAVLGVLRDEAPNHLLDTLAAAGWSVTIVAAEAGVRVTARRGEVTHMRDGPELADVVLLLATLCARAPRVRASRPESA